MPRLNDDVDTRTNRGCQSDEVACEFLRAKGYEILERNATPYERDRRIRIDIVAYDRIGDTLVFVEIKQHARLLPYGSRLHRIDKRRLHNLKVAFGAWCRRNRWEGGYRFDVIEIYRSPKLYVWRHLGINGIDHIENVWN